MRRRGFLVGLGSIAVGSAAVLDTAAFTTVDADRGVNVSVADEGNGALGIVGMGPLKKNAREAMVEYTNNTGSTLTITTTLDTCADGTLYDNEGGSGCSVTAALAAGNSAFVDLEPGVTGTVTYSISVSSTGLNIETNGSVTVESGNTAGAVQIQKPAKDGDFTADVQSNDFEIKSVDVRDNDGDTDLDRIEFSVREGGSNGTVVGSKDVTDPPGDRYSPKGNPSETIAPNSGYTIRENTTYALTVTAYDTDGNFASETVEDTT